MTHETSGMPPQPDQSETGPSAPASAEPPIASGSLVAVVVSRGPASTPQGTPLSAPSVIGTPQGDALAKLQTAGLSADVQNDHNPAVAQGTVIAQYPAPGQSAVPGSATVLIVSKGALPSAPPMVGLPDVVGMSEDGAVSRLKDAGLSPHVVREHSRTVPEGVVIAQLPNAVSLSQVPQKRVPAWA